MKDFVHLRYRSPYSILEGALSIDGAAEACKREFMPALAITDTNNMFGALEFSEKLSKQGIQPIIGLNLSMDGGSLVLLCMSEIGYKNLMEISSHYYINDHVIDQAFLSEFSDGLICLTGGKGGKLNNLCKKKSSKSEEYLLELKQAFGDRLYVEIQRHYQEELEIEERLINLAYKHGLPIVATNDIFFRDKNHHKANDALICIGEKSYLTEGNRRKISEENFFKPSDEMVELFMDIPEAIDSTLEIAKRCCYKPSKSKPLLPSFGGPEKEFEELYSLAKASLSEKIVYNNIRNVKTYYDRLDYEVSVIKDMGYCGYFLIVSDFIQWAKDQGIPVGPGRGSGAGSIVAWCLSITDLDPIRYELIFERFLNPDRVSMPDFDIDFCQTRRGEVIEYVKNKYGEDRVAGICTFGTLKAKALVNDIGRVMQLPYGQVSRISSLINDTPTNPLTLEQAVALEPLLRKEAAEDQKVEKLFEYGKILEGMNRNVSTHAAGIVIADRPIKEITPLYKDQSSDLYATQFPMKYAEASGLVKFDFLGLKTLTVIDNCLKRLKRKNIDIDFNDIDRDDSKTYELLKSGNSLGVFQIESPGMRDTLKKLQPNSMEEISALISLYRPGPMQYIPDYIYRKFGIKEIEYDDPCLEPILKETYGVMVYQEQVMEIARVFSGYTLAQADLLRRGIGKKIKSEIDAQKDNFINGAVNLGKEKYIAEKIFSDIEKFADYSFNKCLDADSLITDFDTGLQHRIEDIFKNSMKFRTLSLNSDKKLEPKYISRSYSNGVKDVYELTTKSGNKIRSTFNHKYLKYDGWSKLSDLKEGDMIATPRNLFINDSLKQCNDSSWPDYKLITLGWIISEGNTCHPSTIYFFNNDIEEIKDFCKYVSSFENTTFTITKKKTGCYNVATKRHPFKQGEKSGVYNWFESLGLTYKKATEKFLPEEVFSLSDEKLSLLLGRLWAGDGHIFGKRGAAPFYATSSFQLAKDVRRILTRLNIQSSLHYKKFKYRGGIKKGYAVRLKGDGSFLNFFEKVCKNIPGKGSQVKDFEDYLKSIDLDKNSSDFIPKEVCFEVRKQRLESGLSWKDFEKVSGKSMKEFCSISKTKRGFRRSTVRHIGEVFKNENLINDGLSDIFWDTIKEIKYVGKFPTYDIEVEGNHNYIADNVIVHNSHSISYSYISFQTAYLKAHHPSEFMAALMDLDSSNTDKLDQIVRDCKNIGLEILPPCINQSSSEFLSLQNSIRYSLSAIKTAPIESIKYILEVRKDSPFKDIEDFCQRVDFKKINKKTIEGLSWAGAFDCFGVERNYATHNYEALKAYSESHNSNTNQISLFEEYQLKTESPERWSDIDILDHEFKKIGFFLSGHPLDGMDLTFSSSFDKMFGKGKKRINTAFRITKIIRKKSGSGTSFAIALVSDPDGAYDIPIWEDILEKIDGIKEGDLMRASISLSENTKGRDELKKSIISLQKIEDLC